MTDALRDGKLRRDVVWNLASLAIVGVGGILLNVLIARFHGAAALGVFNQVFAVYIFFAQFAAGGVHLSALRAVAQHLEDRRRCDAIITAAVNLTFGLSVAFTAIFWLSRHPIGDMLNSPGIVHGMAWATPGLFCFSLNKTMLGVINGLRWMKLYAVAQALRPVCMIAGLALLPKLGLPIIETEPETLGRVAMVLTLAEAAVALLLAAAVIPRLAWPGAMVREWIHAHLHFGVRSFGSGVLLELNTRIDVLMLGFFYGDALVGIYSFAAVLVEGIGQIPIVLRSNLNPLIARHLARDERAELEQLAGKSRRLTALGMLGVGAAAVALYPLLAQVGTADADFASSWPLFAILMTGMVAGAGYMPLGQVLLQAGRPATHTLMTTAVLGFNFVANALLIPPLQALGAAIATALAFVVSAMLIREAGRRILNIRL